LHPDMIMGFGGHLISAGGRSPQDNFFGLFIGGFDPWFYTHCIQILVNGLGLNDAVEYLTIVLRKVLLIQ
jgi:hypothetical protein